MSDPHKASLEGNTPENPQDEVDSTLQLKGGLSLPSGGWARGIQQYLGEVRTEFRKISWPTRRQVTTETVVVIGVVVLLTLLILVLDWGFALIANKLLV